jgi:hypothetical protein
MAITLNTENVRTDLEDFWPHSGVLADRRRPHHPFLALVVRGDEVTVCVIPKSADARLLPPETVLLAQWEGEFRSDFFRFTAGELNREMTKRERALNEDPFAEE